MKAFKISANKKNMLTAELHSASAYIDRLFHAVIEMSFLHGRTSLKEICEALTLELIDRTKENFFNVDIQITPPQSNGAKTTREFVRELNQLYLSMIKLNFGGDTFFKDCVDFINTLYDYGHKIHELCHYETDLEIQYPRVNLIEMRIGNQLITPESPLPVDELKESEIAKFKLPKEFLKACDSKTSTAEIADLNWQRDRKHQELIQLGHEQVFHKNFENALDMFKKAQTFKETGEVLTLIAWVYGLLNNHEKAKSFCLKAIKKDPNYGPPYNDLGAILLREGEVNESLKWFEMAKNSLNYQNREFPYINAGRAYVGLRKYEKALTEFQQALKLAPFHKDLKETIEKIKKTIMTYQLKKDHDKLEKNNLSAINKNKLNSHEHNPPELV